MSLARFTLRALATAALLPQAGDIDLITMAGDQVFPDELNPLQLRADQNDMPVITVYTDDDLAEMRNQDNRGPMRRHVTLRVEITIGSFSTIENTFTIPTTSQELEAKLDIFEQQVKWALFSWSNRPASSAFRRYIIRTTSIQSHPERNDANNKLASRRLLISLQIPDDCSVPTGVGQAPDYPGVVKITKDMFPTTPWLADMFVALQGQPSYRPILDVLGKTGHPAFILPLLKRFGAVADPLNLKDPDIAAKVAAGQTFDHGGHSVAQFLVGDGS